MTIGENPAVQLATSPRIYTCGDAKVDRCTSTVTQQQNIHSVCGVSRPANSDPFHSGEADTVAVCHVALADVGGAGTTNLVNTCSYPSEQPNSDPSDCVLIARDAFIRIQKIIDVSAAVTFNFNITPLPGGIASNPAVSQAFTNGGVTTLTSSYLPIQSGVDHNVAEVVASGWEIDTSTGNAPSCTGSTLSGGNGSFSTATISNVEAAPDNQITCTFKNKLQLASVNVTKTGSDSGSQNGAVFTLYAGTGTGGTVVGTCTVSSGQCAPSSGPSSPSFPNLLPGTYTLDETSVPAGYTKPASLPDTFSVVGGESKSIPITNAAEPGSAAITKLDDANNPVAVPYSRSTRRRESPTACPPDPRRVHVRPTCPGRARSPT